MSTPCDAHGERISDHESRISVLETLVGANSAEGLRKDISELSAQIRELTATIQDQRVASAQKAGQIQGATWVGRIIWAVFGAGALAIITKWFGVGVAAAAAAKP